MSDFKTLQAQRCLLARAQHTNSVAICIIQRHRHFSVMRSAFLHMLQALPSQATIVSPAALLRHVSSTRAIQQEGGGSVEEPWNQDLLQALLAAIYKVSMPSDRSSQSVVSL